MTIIDNFGGGYNVQEKPVEYYKTNSKDKIFKSKSVKDTNFNRVLGTTSKIAQKEVTKTGSNKNGTNIAHLKEVAKEFTDLFYGLLWNLMNERINENPEGGFGEAMFQKSLWPELVKSTSGNKLDKLGEAILEDLKRQQGYKEKNDIE